MTVEPTNVKSPVQSFLPVSICMKRLAVAPPIDSRCPPLPLQGFFRCDVMDEVSGSQGRFNRTHHNAVFFGGGSENAERCRCEPTVLLRSCTKFHRAC